MCLFQNVQNPVLHVRETIQPGLSISIPPSFPIPSPIFRCSENCIFLDTEEMWISMRIPSDLHFILRVSVVECTNIRYQSVTPKLFNHCCTPAFFIMVFMIFFSVSVGPTLEDSLPIGDYTISFTRPASACLYG